MSPLVGDTYSLETRSRHRSRCPGRRPSPLVGDTYSLETGGDGVSDGLHRRESPLVGDTYSLEARLIQTAVEVTTRSVATRWRHLFIGNDKAPPHTLAKRIGSPLVGDTYSLETRRRH